MNDFLVERNLVRWFQPGTAEIGVVSTVEQNGKRISVRLDSGETKTFVWPSEVVERFVLDVGQHVRISPGGKTGVINGVETHGGLSFYAVSHPGGQTAVVMEDSVRPAPITDPVERLRAGHLNTARSTNLRVAATRLSYAHQHDALSTLGNSRVEIKPHQVGVVHRVASSYPHRFILADEVGLGKTIEAGLLIRELRARGVAPRVLILAPSGLVTQWQQELQTKFNMAFSLYNRDTVKFLENKHPNENVWAIENSVIASTSFAAHSDDRRRDLAAAGWDMVVVDEAHHARRTYQGSGKYTTTNLYRLVEGLADPDLARAQSMLFLSATPMQLHRYELYSLIELLDPALFPTPGDFDDHVNDLRGLNRTVEKVKRWSALRPLEREAVLGDVQQWLGEDKELLRDRAETANGLLVDQLEGEHRLSRVMVRNRKRVVGGFMPRKAAIWEVELTPEEHDAYWATMKYVQTGYARSRATQNNALGFLMATFQKLNASSSYALKGSLSRRIARLEQVDEEQHRNSILDENFASIADALEEAPTADALEDLLAQRLDADWEEIRELEGLVDRLEAIEMDSKLRVLLENLHLIAEREPNAKVIIFTQYRDTQDYLAKHIRYPWSVNLFHGQLKPQEKDAAVATFRDLETPQILLSTEAGGEGRNFQYCHILVNYDLPWNPMKVEQRIGRVDRIGQKSPVTVFNFSTLGTIEERVVEVLTNRIGIFEETVGGLDPILGEVEADLTKIFRLAQDQADEEFQRLGDSLQARVAGARKAEERLADLIMDTRSYRKEEVEALLARPRTVSPLDIQRFVLGALSEMGVRIDRDRGNEGVYLLALNPAFERYFPDEFKRGSTRQVTFELSVALDREEVDFIAFGHPIVDGLVEYVRRPEYGGITSQRLVLSDEQEPVAGWLFVYSLELQGFGLHRELHPVFVREDGTSNGELAGWLLDRAMTGRKEEFVGTGEPASAGDAFDQAVGVAGRNVVVQLMGRRSALEAGNAQHLADERRKRERLYDYRSQAAADKLTANRTTLERLKSSDEDSSRKVIPIWEKNVVGAEKMVARVEEERIERLAELDGRDAVSAQHELLAASWVRVEPDPAPLLEQVSAALTESMFKQFKRLCLRSTPDELLAFAPKLDKRRTQLLALSKKFPFDVELATAIADTLLAALEDLDRFASRELGLLRGAIEYFLEVQDEAHDLKDPKGFHDDAAVASIVLETIGRPELSVVGDQRA